MATFDEIVDKKLGKEDIKNTQFMLLIKYRDNYNKATKEEAKKKNLRNFRKLYEKIKDSLTPDEDDELVESLSEMMYAIYLEINLRDSTVPEPEPEPEPDEESNQELRHLRVSRHIKTLGKAREKFKKSRKKKRKKSRKKKSKKHRRSKPSKK